MVILSLQAKKLDRKAYAKETMQLSSIIFDMDGVLIDSEPVHKLAKKRAFERFGISLPEDVYEKYKGRPDDTMMIEVVRSIGHKNLEPEELIRIKHEEFEAIEHMVVRDFFNSLTRFGHRESQLR